MNSILIRAEDKNIWERRAPIIPPDIKEILSEIRTDIFVQKSEKRFFPAADYKKVGAIVCENMEPGDIILGIKEIPQEKLLDNKVYVFFSHTIKGQSENMPMLKKIISGGSTLIDYEKITDVHDKRLIYFGNYAGDAGSINILWLMGAYWRHHGFVTPFGNFKQAINYASVSDAKNHLREIGNRMASKGLPPDLCPLVIGILGYGNVSSGAQEIIDCLPTQRIEPENLTRFVEKNQGDNKTVYVTVFKEHHLVKHKQNKPFLLQDYYRRPENYVSQFDQYLPYISILINAIYWDKRYPKFVTWESLNNIFKLDKTPKLCGISDITCDKNGSIECNVKSTNSGVPAYLCDPIKKTIADGYKGNGIVLLAIDNLPAELPNDSSIFFSNQLKKFVPNLVQANYSLPLEKSGLRPEIQKAVIVYRGQLTTPFKYLQNFLP